MTTMLPPLPLLAAPDLTDRELQVLERVARGATIEETAADLGITVHTVKTHIKHLFDKLGARNAAAAVSAGYLCGLLTVPRRVIEEQMPKPMCRPLERDLLAVAQAVVWADPSRTARPMVLRSRFRKARAEGRLR